MKKMLSVIARYLSTFSALQQQKWLVIHELSCSRQTRPAFRQSSSAVPSKRAHLFPAVELSCSWQTSSPVPSDKPSCQRQTSPAVLCSRAQLFPADEPSCPVRRAQLLPAVFKLERQLQRWSCEEYECSWFRQRSAEFQGDTGKRRCRS